MRRPLFVVFFSYLLTLVSNGCSDHGSPVPPVIQIEQPIALVVQPDSGRVGAPIIIRDSLFKVSRTYVIQFPGADDVLVVNCNSASTLQTFVAFGAVSGQIAVDIDGHLGFTQPFNVTGEVDTLALSVTGLDISSPLTPGDSSVIDRMHFRRTWYADIAGDTVHISRGYSTGDEYFEIHFVLLNIAPGVLPRLLKVWTYTKPDYPGSWADTVRTGVLKVQDWNMNGVMSGRFFGKPSIVNMSNGTAAFWVDRSR